jgi:hypothetical protein
MEKSDWSAIQEMIIHEKSFGKQLEPKFAPNGGNNLYCLVRKSVCPLITSGSSQKAADQFFTGKGPMDQFCRSVELKRIQ